LITGVFAIDFSKARLIALCVEKGTVVFSLFHNYNGTQSKPSNSELSYGSRSVDQTNRTTQAQTATTI
jgi:hypothetical protein